MSGKTIILITILFTLIVIGMFVFAYLKQGELQTQTTLLHGATSFN